MNARAVLFLSLSVAASLSTLSACSSSDDVLPPLTAGTGGGAGAGGHGGAAGSGGASAGVAGADDATGEAGARPAAAGGQG